MAGYSSRWRRLTSSTRACNSAAVAHVPGSALSWPKSCDRSTTPFRRDDRGGFQIIPTPSPIRHRARAVDRPPVAPHGVPLSTLIRAGVPHRAKARRRASWTPGVTRAQVPRGKTAVPRTAPVHSSVIRNQLASPCRKAKCSHASICQTSCGEVDRP
ncbi:MAG: hypothetical protein JWO38_6899 [Gemmataceae bacterium]|nr:hypothetical protein [Gemmataceae bacterium]